MKRTLAACWALALAALTACASSATLPAPSSTPTLRSGTLAPFQTITATVTVRVPDPSTSTPLPTVTPTPRTHVVKAGEDMGGIALRYRVKLADLKAANPTVTPNLMRIGTVLIIPGNAPDYSPTGAATATPTPTALLLERPTCSIDALGGATCFVVARNMQKSGLENVSVAVSLLDAKSKVVTRQVVTTPLDLLPPGTSQPVMAYFNAPLPAGYQVAIELVSALPATVGGNRYLSASLSGQQVKISTDGLTADVSGTVVSQADQAAKQVWVAAVAYGADGSVVGVRRWTASGAMPAKASLPFSLSIYSAAGPITRVDSQVEARP